MMHADYIQAYKDLLTQLSYIEKPRDVSFTSFEAAVTSLNPGLPLSDCNTGLSVALSALTEHVVFTCGLTKNHIYKNALLATLADATRQNPIWRSLFGPVERSEDKSTTCILDVAQQIIVDCLFQSQGQEVESALRLIANCCADNNGNRKRFVTRNGISQLVDHLTRAPRSNLLIPTIYNVCNDYEEPDTELDQSVISSQSLPEEEASATTISLTARELAAVCADRQDISTFELLLAPSARPVKEQTDYLAALVELAALPATDGLVHVFGARAPAWQWSFIDHREKVLTLEAANKLADESLECRLSVLRAILYILSQDEARNALLKRHDESILQLIQIATFHPQQHNAEDFKEEMNACHKEFFKLFYELTGTPTFSEDEKANMGLAMSCLDTLYSTDWSPEKGLTTGSQESGNGSERMEVEVGIQTAGVDDHTIPWRPLFVKSCALIILAQLSIHDRIRDMLISSRLFPTIIWSTFCLDHDPDTLYPAITLVAKLSASPKGSQVLGTDYMLHHMKRLITEGGLGLIIPYEVVNVYRLLFRGRPECLIQYTRPLDGTGMSLSRRAARDPANASIISGITTFFDRTIEAGTKLAIGHFFIELLRTVFPSVKDLDDTDLKTESTDIVDAFRTFLETTAIKVSEILSFVCTQAEPKEQRVHGWFGLGMLSIWARGRCAIVNAIEHHSLDQGILEVSRASEGPALQNLKLVLSKMQRYPRETLSEKTLACLDEAAHNLGMTVTIT